MTRTIKTCIAASLLLNLLLAGVLAGQWLKGGGDYAPPSRWREALTEHLPPDRQAIYDRAMQAAREDNEPTTKALREAWQEVREALRADPFDKRRYLAAMEQVRRLDVQRKTRTAEAIAEAASQFTAAERAALAEAMRRPVKRPHHKEPEREAKP
jgi:uncharacterized membrane protein